MWRCQANEIAMRRHFATSTGCRRRVTETGVPLNAMMAPQGYMIIVYHITNIFYKYRRCTNFCLGFTNPNDNFYLL